MARPGFAARTPQSFFDLQDTAPGARHAQMLESKSELPAQLVEQAEIQVAAKVARRQLDRFAQLQLRLGEEPGLEENQAEVGAQDFGRRVLGQERPGRRGRLVVVPALELEERDEVQDVIVAGTQGARLRQLVPGLLELTVAQTLARAIQVQKKETLVDGWQIASGARHPELAYPRRRAGRPLFVVRMTRFVRASRSHRTGRPSEAAIPRNVSAAGFPKPPPSVDLP